MLQIVRMEREQRDVTLELRGQVVAEWVAVLEEETRKLVRAGSAVELDLSDVTRVSARGLEMIRGLLRDGVTVIGSPLIEQMLDAGGSGE